MAFEKYKRKAAVNFFVRALRNKLKFKGNVTFKSVAGLTPDLMNEPALFVFRGTDPMIDLTNEEREATMLVHVVAFVRDDTDSLELAKMDIQDDIEETVYDDITMGGNITQATVTNADPTAFSLNPLGFAGPVLPPLGAVRMDVRFLFEYRAL